LDFSLPVDPTLPPQQIRYMLVTLPLFPTLSVSTDNNTDIQTNSNTHTNSNHLNYNADDVTYLNGIHAKLLITSKFEFSNRIWDYLENIMEYTHANDNLQDIRGAMRMIMNALNQAEVNANTTMLLTCTNPEDLLQQILNN